MNNAVTTKISKTPQQLATETFAEGRKLDGLEFYRAGGSCGDYYYNAYSRAWSKLKREAEEAEKTALAGANASLLETLFEQTEILKVEFLQKTAEWAVEDFARIEKFVKTATVKQLEGETQRKFYARQKRADAIGQVYEKGLELFITGKEKAALAHYEDSIRKLAARIEAKDLNKETLSIQTAKIGVNIETVFTDGVKTVRAFTIVAFGVIQKPHYRYLVK